MKKNFSSKKNTIKKDAIRTPSLKKSQESKLSTKKVKNIHSDIAAHSNNPSMPSPNSHQGRINENGTAPQKKFNENNPFYHIINQVVDPEIGVGIADMGIIYDVQQKDNLVEVVMTLTSMGCPAGPEITTDVDAILRLQDGVDDVHINVVWEPAWTPEMMKPELKAMLFGG